jgi:hypothetical protein
MEQVLSESVARTNFNAVLLRVATLHHRRSTRHEIGD